MLAQHTGDGELISRIYKELQNPRDNKNQTNKEISKPPLKKRAKDLADIYFFEKKNTFK